jgi:hypothetical protein
MNTANDVNLITGILLIKGTIDLFFIQQDCQITPEKGGIIFGINFA